VKWVRPSVQFLLAKKKLLVVGAEHSLECDIVESLVRPATSGSGHGFNPRHSHTA
jgi:hypothetical protein